VGGPPEPHHKCATHESKRLTGLSRYFVSLPVFHLKTGRLWNITYRQWTISRWQLT